MVSDVINHDYKIKSPKNKTKRITQRCQEDGAPREIPSSHSSSPVHLLYLIVSFVLILSFIRNLQNIDVSVRSTRCRSKLNLRRGLWELPVDSQLAGLAV